MPVYMHYWTSYLYYKDNDFVLIKFPREVGTDPREAPLDKFCNQLWLRPAGPAYEVDQPVPEKRELQHGPLTCRACTGKLF
jgi:hypothetical protein